MMKVGRRLAATPAAATAAWEPTDTAWTQATHKYDGSEPESNGLSAKAVLEAAAARVGRGQPGAATAGAADDLGALSAWLAQRGVLHGWQLEHLERADWEAAGATLGLRSAVRAALLPSTEAAGGARRRTWPSSSSRAFSSGSSSSLTRARLARSAASCCPGTRPSWGRCWWS